MSKNFKNSMYLVQMQLEQIIVGNLYFFFFKLKPDKKVIRNLVFDVADPISKKLTIYS